MLVTELNGTKEGNAKFLVVDGKVYMTELAVRILLTHPELGIKDGVHEEIIRLRGVDPSKVCGGVLTFYDNILTVLFDSSGYKLPVIGSEAEQHAIDALKKIIAPGIILRLSEGKQYPQNAPLMLD